MSVIRGMDRYLRLVGLVSFGLLLLFAWQGLDFTDMGFWLTGYQVQYHQPHAMAAACWLSNFVGHWSGLALGGSVIAYKLAYVTVITVSAMIAYRLLATQLGSTPILAGTVLLTVFFARGWGGNWIGYNELTALFYVAGAVLCFFGLVRNRKLMVGLGSVVLGANVFVRFPNLLGITLISTVWLYAWSSHWSLQDVVGWSFLFIAGFTVGAALGMGLILLHGQEGIYKQAIQELLGSSVNVNSIHSGSSLINLFIVDHFKAFAEGLLVLLIGGRIATWISMQKKLTALLIIFVSLPLVYFMYIRGHSRWIVPGICYIVLLSIVIMKSKKDPAFALLAFISSMVLLLVPLGSTNGISNARFGMWLALPLTLVILWQSCDKVFCFDFDLRIKGGESLPHSGWNFEIRGMHIFGMILVFSLLTQSVASAWRHTYLDSKDRLAMTHSIPHPLLVGTFTTAERANVVADLLDAMAHFVGPGDEVLAYNAIPMVHFLTETQPYLGDPWPDMVPAEKLGTLIRTKEQTGAKLPYIVRATGSTYHNAWPIDLQPVATWWQQDESRRVFLEFEQRHGYVVVWSNGFFEILSTAQNDTTGGLGS